ncbi:hypothetical protein ACLMJK_001156 [Lecanora helva]
MTAETGLHGFTFINASSARVPRDAATRKMIRRQAMLTTAAARRQKGNYGKVNLGQCPVFVSPQHDSKILPLDLEPDATEVLSKDTRTIDRKDSLQREGATRRTQRTSSLLPTNYTINLTPSKTGYESMILRYDFDILNLSALTGVHCGRTTASALIRKPSQLHDVLRCRQSSYLSFIPSRFGHTACLDDAARCIAIRARQRLLSPTSSPSTEVVAHYAKALTSLHTALDDANRRLEPDVLCAIELLAIYELLDGESNRGWIRHTAGATLLVKLRGPQGYKTDFEKALFIAHAGPTFTEALLQGKPCFLEEPSWQVVFRSATMDSSPFTDASSVTIALWMSVCQVPRLLAKVEAMICQPGDIDSLEQEQLTLRLLRVRDWISDWRRRYEILISKDNARSSSKAKTDKRYEALGVALGIRIVLNRLILAINMHRAADLENESQSLAHQVICLEQQARATNPRAGLFMAFKMIIARATIETKRDWEQSACPSATNNIPSRISKEAFTYWCRLKQKQASYHH